MTILLTWKQRYPKRDRPKVLALVQKAYPTAKDTGEGVQIRTRKHETRPAWMFLLWKCSVEIA